MKTITKYNPKFNCWYEFNPVREEIVNMTEVLRALVNHSDRVLIHLNEEAVDYEAEYEYMLDKLDSIMYPNLNVY